MSRGGKKDKNANQAANIKSKTLQLQTKVQQQLSQTLQTNKERNYHLLNTTLHDQPRHEIQQAEADRQNTTTLDKSQSILQNAPTQRMSGVLGSFINNISQPTQYNSQSVQKNKSISAGGLGAAASNKPKGEKKANHHSVLSGSSNLDKLGYANFERFENLRNLALLQ